MIGPVQLLVLGFTHPDFTGEIAKELEQLRESDTMRVIDSLVVYKDADAELEVAHLSTIPQEERAELGTIVRALIGLDIEGEEPTTGPPDDVGADDVEGWDILDDIPRDSAAALVLLEHHWAIPLRDALVRAGGFRISDGFISPLDLAAIGLLSAADAGELHAIENAVS